jgi:diguanylate cyclase (GGDEF)-like protein
MARSKKTRKTDASRKATDSPSRRSVSGVAADLLGMGESLRSARVLEEALHAVTGVAVRLTRSFQTTLRLLDESGKRLLTSARTGPSVHRRGARPFRQGEGFIGWVVMNSEPSFTNGPASDPRFVHREGQKWTPSAVMAVPLLCGKECIGVLSASRRNDVPYTRLDLDLLRLVVQLSVPHLEIARLTRLNESDPLTLLHNRRYLQERLPAEMQRSVRSGRPLAIAMIDIDHFKRVNDRHGHDVGDEVLCEVADRLRRVSRSSDVVARWGGEEFLALFPETNLRQGRIIAERIRRAIGLTSFQTSVGVLTLSVSVGLCTMVRGDDELALIQRVDQAMYTAKRQGRDRVVVASNA